MSTELRQQDKTAIVNLKQSGVETTTAGLKRFLHKSSWIGKTNHYSNDVVSRLKKALPATKTHRRNLAQYIAASITLHANDGWSYLGRAIGCLLTGDTHRALHLAYYAELRAAMSLLAGFGIGIFDHQHFIVAQANSTAKLHTKLGTHRMVWLALEEWAKLPSSGKIFAELVRPEGYDLDEWFQLHGGASKLAPQARAWFLQWGMDLRLASKDRYARNESSYRPDGVPITWQADPALCLNFVRDMWTLLEPSSTSSFEQIDRHIFRLSIERYFRGLTGKPSATGDPAFAALVGKTVSRFGLPRSAEKRIKDFLCRKVSAADPLVFRYSAYKPGTPNTDAFAVVSRAVLLLRLATGSAHRLLQRTSINANDLAFWWQSLGEHRGIWPPGTPPAEPYDLWADVKESLDAVARIEEESRPPLDSFSSIAAGLAPQLTVLASHERVGIWGLCPS